MAKKLEAITIPKWGIEMTEGRITEWHCAVGDTVTSGEEIVDIETDKIVNSFEARVSGELVRILAEEDEELPVGTLIGVIALESVTDAELDEFIAGYGKQEGSARRVEESTVTSASPNPEARPDVRISPALRRKLAAANIDPATVRGTGPRGRIMKEDADRAIAAGGGTQPVPMTGKALAGAQKAVAERLSEAQRSVPIYHVSMDVGMDAALARLKDLREQGRVSVNDLVVMAVGAALDALPAMNVVLEGNTIRAIGAANVAVAVATEGAVYAPVIRDLTSKTPHRVAEELVALGERARMGRLKSGDTSDAAISVSNLGMFGVREFTAMIAPPQVMILSVGTVRRELVIEDDGSMRPRSVMTVTLGCDHRVVNGAEAARFLGQVRDALEAGSS